MVVAVEVCVVEIYLGVDGSRSWVVVSHLVAMAGPMMHVEDIHRPAQAELPPVFGLLQHRTSLVSSSVDPRPESRAVLRNRDQRLEQNSSATVVGVSAGTGSDSVAALDVVLDVEMQWWVCPAGAAEVQGHPVDPEVFCHSCLAYVQQSMVFQTVPYCCCTDPSVVPASLLQKSVGDSG